ncbi:hypothetical protein F4778DRAFT_391798 [Xylariomycetidae sp. FL2044]|nr:hypothetical protein F4778DRAFT_391798 [Xylariomycetidae sp. FL2044]
MRAKLHMTNFPLPSILDWSCLGLIFSISVHLQNETKKKKRIRESESRGRRKDTYLECIRKEARNARKLGTPLAPECGQLIALFFEENIVYWRQGMTVFVVCLGLCVACVNVCVFGCMCLMLYTISNPVDEASRARRLRTEDGDIMMSNERPPGHVCMYVYMHV